MGRVVEIDEALWVRLNDAAKQARRTPEGLVRSLIREYLEVEADRALDEALREAVKSSGRKEKDAVRIIHPERCAISAYRTEVEGLFCDGESRFRRPRLLLSTTLTLG